MIKTTRKIFLLSGIVAGLLTTYNSRAMEFIPKKDAPLPISLFMQHDNERRPIEKNGEIFKEPALWINKNTFKVKNGEVVQKRKEVNEILVGFIWKDLSCCKQISVTHKYTFDNTTKCFKLSLLDESNKFSLPITISKNQQKKLREMQLGDPGKVTAIANNQLYFIYDCHYLTDDTTPTCIFSERWNDLDDSFSDENSNKEDSFRDDRHASTTTIEIPKVLDPYDYDDDTDNLSVSDQDHHISTTRLYEYSPSTEEYQLVDNKGRTTNNTQPLEAKFRGIIVKNENNTFCFQITAEQTKQIWNPVSINLISIQIAPEQFKMLEQNQQINNSEKKTFVIVNPANQVFIIDGILKKSYFTVRNFFGTVTFISVIGVIMYAMQKYNISFPDFKISEFFKNISFLKLSN